jgi:Na+/proline symporter
MHTSYYIDGWAGFLMEIFLVGIPFGYIIIAGQFWRKRNGDPVARRALGQLFAIFVFCSFAGYVPRLIHFPTWLMVSVHAVLFFVTWRYVLSRQAEVIADTLERARDRDQSK